MSHASPTSILLNIGHAMDHWIIVVFAYTWGVIAGVWGVEWTELTPFNYGALFMFGVGSIVSGRLGDLWGRWIMMVIFFAGMGVSALVIALCSNKWQIGAALTLMGAFASIYHPVGIPMLVQKAKNYGFTIGVNGLAGNMGIAIAAGVSVYIAQRFGWQMAFIMPGRDLPGVRRGLRGPGAARGGGAGQAQAQDDRPAARRDGARVRHHDLRGGDRQHHLQLHHQR